MKKTLTTMLLRTAYVALAALLLNVLGIVGISYLRGVDNDPFPVAVQVRTIDDDHIELDDGRVITNFGGLSSDDRDRIKDSKGRLGLEIESGGIATLYSRRSRTICGVGMPIFTIPLVPLDVPRYERKLFVIGKISYK